MRLFSVRYFLLTLTLIAVSGCIPLWVGAGAAGIVGGYMVSPDTVAGTIEHAYEDVMDASKEIVAIMGQVVEEGPNGSYLVAMIGGTKVTVNITAVSISTTSLSVKARKSYMPKIDLAQDVYTKIYNYLSK